MAIDFTGRAALRLVPSTAEEACPSQWFCGHCGAPPPNNETPAPPARVCGECGLGLLLEAPDALRPAPSEAFVVVDRTLTIHALSKRAERLLGLREIDALDKHVTDLLV
ncbi:MAG TPA: hypothetical protein VFU94_10955, partial [Conexibacter sp.]|nr:hypothetical protein [Conexibacter sp.]